MNTEYNPEVIEKFATALYLRADRIVRGMAIKYGFCGVIAGFLVGAVMTSKLNAGLVLPLIMTVVFGIIAGYIGVKNGEEKAFSIRLEAQTALCQVEIEKNSRNNTKLSA